MYKDSSIDREKSTRLKYLVKSVDGKTDRKHINNFVDNEFLSMDALELRQYISSITPDVKFESELTNSQGGKELVTVPITVNFFWPGNKL